MTTRITRVENDNGDNYYIVSFEDFHERAFWLIAHDFRYAPLDDSNARWVCSHNGSDSRHSLELVPYAKEHRNNLRSLYMRCNLHPFSEGNHLLAPQSESPPRNKADE